MCFVEYIYLTPRKDTKTRWHTNKKMPRTPRKRSPTHGKRWSPKEHACFKEACAAIPVDMVNRMHAVSDYMKVRKHMRTPTQCKTHAQRFERDAFPRLKSATPLLQVPADCAGSGRGPLPYISANRCTRLRLYTPGKARTAISSES